MHSARSSSSLPTRLLSLGTAALFLVLTVQTSAGFSLGVRPAQAQERPSVAVVGVHGAGEQSDELLRTLTDDLADGFRIAARYDVVDAAVLAPRFLPAQAQIVESVFLGPANDALREGRLQYEGARFESAVEACRRAESSVAGHLEFVRDQRLLVDIQLFLGLSYASMGAKDDARDAFGEVVRLAPDRVLDSLEYPPKIVSLFEQARSEVLSSEGASVRVLADDTTRVFLDGRRIGNGDVVVSDLPPGFHVLLAESAGVGRQFMELRLGPGETREVQIELTNVGLGGDTSAQSDRSSLTRRLYEEVARVAGTDLVAVAAFDPDGNLQMALYSARSDTWSEAVEASLKASPSARTAFVKQLVERLALYADDSGAIKSDRVSARVPALVLGGNPTLDDLLFAAPAPAAVAVADPSTIPEPRARSKKERAPVKPGAVIGVILGILGAGGAATGIYFAVRPQPEPIGTLQITIP